MAKAINDGFTFHGYLDEVPGLHGPLRFRYRPALVEEGSEFFEQASKLKARQGDQHTAKFLRAKLVSWDARWPADDPREPLTVLNPKAGAEPGTVAELTAGHILFLKRTVFQRLLSIVLGQAPSDADPEISFEQQPDPIIPLTEQLAADAKNS